MDNTIINDSTKRRILEEILASEDFHQAQKYRDLLGYLVGASINQEKLKESTIAIDFFSKDGAFDPTTDSSVRAYISNLRKKLEHYYLTQGRNDKIKLAIPKGHYHVEFIQNGDRADTATRASRKRWALAYLPLVLGMLLAAFAIWQMEKPKSTSFNIIAQDEPIWGSLFTNNLKTIIVMGDYYFFALPIDSSRHSYIRDIAINSDEDLEAFMASHPQLRQKIRKTYHTYLEELLPKCVAYVLPSFVSHDKPLELKLASELQLEDLQKANIVYIGPYKTLQVLKTVTRNLNFKYSPQTGGSILTFALQDSNKVLTYSWVTNPETKARNDYAMVVKVFGYNGNVLLFFMSEHDFGNVAIVKYLTNPTTLKEFGKQVASGNFEALFEVKGIVHTDFSTQLLQINKLHADFQIDLP